MLTRGQTLQDILAQGERARDLSGNPILEDAGVWLRNELKAAMKDADLKYIDPSYLIRSIPTTSGDRIYCKVRGWGACWHAEAAHGGRPQLRAEVV